jgi:hypothetical protein
MAVRNNSIASGCSDAERAPSAGQLGRAFDAVVGLPEDLAEQSLAFARTQPTGQARPGWFGPAQIAGEQASAIERLVAFLGRPVNPGR